MPSAPNIFFRRPLSVAWLAMALMLGNAQGQNMYLKLAGIEGESTDARHPREIRVDSWAWAVAKPGAATAPTWVDLAVGKQADIATPKLMEAVSKGQVISNAVLTVINPSGTEFYRIELETVRATSVSLQASEQAVESVTLAFEKLKVQYVPVSGTGLPLPRVGMYWDLVKNTGSSDTTNYLAAAFIATPGSAPQLTWSTEAGKTYEVSVSENPWGPFVPLNTYTAEQGSLSVPIVFDQPRRFFRVKEL